MTEQMTEKQNDKKTSVISSYINHLRAFRPNARLYLLSIIAFGIAGGISQVLFNFYVLSLSYNEAFLGNLVTIRSGISLIVALPMGYLTDRIGRKESFLIGNIGYGVSIALMLLFPSTGMIIAMNFVQGLAQSLSGIASGPFLMENSGNEERTYLFSYSSGIRMVATSVGEWVGGYLPGVFAGVLLVDKMSTTAYSFSLWTVVIMAGVSAIPLFLISRHLQEQGTRSSFAPISYMREHPGHLSKLIVPSLIISVGAGMIMPFMNVFFRNVHHQSDASIGTIFAWGSLAMAVGLMIAPALAEKFGKIQVVIASQALSIPFLIILGFSPWFGFSLFAYYIRTALMNMSGPIYSTFVLEQVKPEARAMVSSLTTMASNFGWAFSPTLSGILQVRYGFKPPFVITIVLYSIAVLAYYLWFWKGREMPGKRGDVLATEPEESV